MVNIEDVYCESGLPTFTFVKPSEYSKLLVSLRTKGRGVVVEGPSGIGKTTCIRKCLQELYPDKSDYPIMSARQKETKEYLDLIISNPSDHWGMVIVDDFHLLDKTQQKQLSDLLKLFADRGRQDDKLVLIGINNAGQNLVDMTPDLNGRIDTIRFERNAEDKIRELIEKGESALSVVLPDKEEIIRRSYGSFHIAQMLCKAMCIADGVLESQETLYAVQSSITNVVSEKIEELGRIYKTVAQSFAKGKRFRRGGTLPYYHILQWLSQTDDGTIYIPEIISAHSHYKNSLNQVTEKGHLKKLLESNRELTEKYLYYDADSKMIAIYDPKFLFYLKNIDWHEFAQGLGLHTSSKTIHPYEVALSFAGEKREIAEAIFDELVANEVSVFYDKDASAEILGRNVEEYLEPIYRSDAKYVVVLVDEAYANKVWTVVESKAYRDKWDKDEVIPIIFDGYQPSPFDKLYGKGYARIYTDKDIAHQVRDFVNNLIVKLDK